MQNNNEYPVGGYAPGSYYAKCTSCGKEFQGDKRAFQCESCGRTSEKFNEYIKEVLQFVSNKHEMGKTGEELLNEYHKHIFGEFIKKYHS